MYTPPWYRMKSIGAACRSLTEQEENGAQDSGGFPHLQTETSYELGHRRRQEPNVECDPVEFSVGTGKVIWLLGKNFVTVSGVMPTFV